jgi:hypothetical protein
LQALLARSLEISSDSWLACCLVLGIANLATI